jgi:hypothetical protein
MIQLDVDVLEAVSCARFRAWNFQNTTSMLYNVTAYKNSSLSRGAHRDVALPRRGGGPAGRHAHVLALVGVAGVARAARAVRVLLAARPDLRRAPPSVPAVGRSAEAPTPWVLAKVGTALRDHTRDAVQWRGAYFRPPSALDASRRPTAVPVHVPPAMLPTAVLPTAVPPAVTPTRRRMRSTRRTPRAWPRRPFPRGSAYR